MGQLGSIFEGTPEPGDRGRGPDLRVQATLDRSLLTGREPLELPVPDRVPLGEGSVPRARSPDDPQGAIHLHLSPDLADRTTLRLRGQGGEHPDGGRPGDLLVELTVVETPPPDRRWIWLLVAVAAGVGAVVLVSRLLAS